MARGPQLGIDFLPVLSLPARRPAVLFPHRVGQHGHILIVLRRVGDQPFETGQDPTFGRGRR